MTPLLRFLSPEISDETADRIHVAMLVFSLIAYYLSRIIYYYA